MVVATVKWFHQVMGHPGEKRLQKTLNQHYYHPRLCYHIEKLKCKDCQKHKLEGHDYGLLPKQEVQIEPWEEVTINLIGPWKVKVNGWQFEFNALDCINTALNLVKRICIDNKTAKHIRDKFTQSWLCWYPRPARCLHEKEGEFIRQNFQWLLEIFSIKDVCSTSKNPQSNAICERMHQTVTNVQRTLVHTNPPWNMNQARDIIDDALATAMHAMKPPLLLPWGVRWVLLLLLKVSFQTCCWLQIGRPLRVLVNIMVMRIYEVLIGSNISMTTLWDNKFWRKCTIQLSWE